MTQLLKAFPSLSLDLVDEIYHLMVGGGGGGRAENFPSLQLSSSLCSVHPTATYMQSAYGKKKLFNVIKPGCWHGFVYYCNKIKPADNLSCDLKSGILSTTCFSPGIVSIPISGVGEC